MIWCLTRYFVQNQKKFFCLTTQILNRSLQHPLLYFPKKLAQQIGNLRFWKFFLTVFFNFKFKYIKTFIEIYKFGCFLQLFRLKIILQKNQIDNKILKEINMMRRPLNIMWLKIELFGVKCKTVHWLNFLLYLFYKL